MAYNEEIDRRIRGLVADWEGAERKKMFGGTCHLLGGHMFCGVLDDKLILRLGEARAAELLSDVLVEEFDITGRPMKGWVMIDEKAFRTDQKMVEWLDLAREFVATLPAKKRK